MTSLFTKILAGEIPSHRIWEDEAHFAFLDIRPVQPGHALVVPKREVSYLFDMSPAEQTALWDAVRQVEAKLKQKLGFERAVLMVIGWEVPHVHVHVIPTHALGDVGMPKACGMSAEEIAALAAKINS